MSSCSQREERRSRYLAKQEIIAAGTPLYHKPSNHSRGDEGNSASTLWMNKNGQVCKDVSLDDVHRLKQYCAESEPEQTHYVDGKLGIDDPKNLAQKMLHLHRFLSPYFDLQSKDLPSSTNRYDQRLRFIAEGTETIRLLIQQQFTTICQDDGSNPASGIWSEPIQIESILVKPNLFFDPPVHLQKDVDNVLSAIESTQGEHEHKYSTINSPFQIFIASIETISALAGFTVSRGCLACGYIPINRTEEWFFTNLNRHIKLIATAGAFRVLALDGITDTANLGSMIRTSSAFGVNAILLSNDCCDAWYRRSIRVSMGHIFRVPIVRVSNLSRILHKLSQPPYDVTSYAAVVDTKTSIALNQLKPGTYLQFRRQCYNCNSSPLY